MDMSSTSFTTGDLTGTVIDSGDGITHVVPIINGYVVATAIKSIPLAGSTITTYVEQNLRQRSAPLPSDNCLQLCRCVSVTLTLNTCAAPYRYWKVHATCFTQE